MQKYLSSEKGLKILNYSNRASPKRKIYGQNQNDVSTEERQRKKVDKLPNKMLFFRI
jgi:hypothetical protein